MMLIAWAEARRWPGARPSRNIWPAIVKQATAAPCKGIPATATQSGGPSASDPNRNTQHATPRAITFR